MPTACVKSIRDALRLKRQVLVHSLPAGALEGGQVVEAAALLAESACLPLDLDLLQIVMLQQLFVSCSAFAAHNNRQDVCVSSIPCCFCSTMIMLCNVSVVPQVGARLSPAAAAHGASSSATACRRASRVPAALRIRPPADDRQRDCLWVGTSFQCHDAAARHIGRRDATAGVERASEC